MSSTKSLISILIIAGITVLTRLLPFLLFPEGRKVPKCITRLSNLLPPAVMGMLVIYCLKDVSFLSGTHALPEIISIMVVILSYLWKKNTLLSILIGTLLYMIQIQFLF